MELNKNSKKTAIFQKDKENDKFKETCIFQNDSKITKTDDLHDVNENANLEMHPLVKEDNLKNENIDCKINKFEDTHVFQNDSKITKKDDLHDVNENANLEMHPLVKEDNLKYENIDRKTNEFEDAPKNENVKITTINSAKNLKTSKRKISNEDKIDIIYLDLIEDEKVEDEKEIEFIGVKKGKHFEGKNSKRLRTNLNASIISEEKNSKPLNASIISEEKNSKPLRTNLNESMISITSNGTVTLDSSFDDDKKTESLTKRNNARENDIVKNEVKSQSMMIDNFNRLFRELSIINSKLESIYYCDTYVINELHQIKTILNIEKKPITEFKEKDDDQEGRNDNVSMRDDSILHDDSSSHRLENLLQGITRSDVNSFVPEPISESKYSSSTLEQPSCSKDNFK